MLIYFVQFLVIILDKLPIALPYCNIRVFPDNIHSELSKYAKHFTLKLNKNTLAQKLLIKSLKVYVNCIILYSHVLFYQRRNSKYIHTA